MESTRTAPLPPAPLTGKQEALRDRVRSLQLPRSAESPAFPWRGLLAALIVVVVAAWLFRGDMAALVGAGGQPQPAQDKAQPAAPVALPTGESTRKGGNPSQATILPADQQTAGSGDVVLESKGYVIPAHQILVSPKVTGMVRELNIEEGARVREGDILAVLESDEFQADHDRAKANLELARQHLRELENGSRPEEIAQAEAELAEAKAQLLDLEPNYRRVQDLYQKKVTTDRELQQAESLYMAMLRRVDRLNLSLKLLKLGPRVERIDAVRAEVKQAEADLAKAAWRLNNCTIRAPITGTILKKNAERGNIVNPMAFNGSFSLCELADLADLEIDLAIQERDVSRIFPSQKCRIRADAWPARTYEGHVSRLMPIADRAKGAVPVRVKIRVPAEEQGQYLKPEMSAIVSFFADTRTPEASGQAVRGIGQVSK